MKRIILALVLVEALFVLAWYTRPAPVCKLQHAPPLDVNGSITRHHALQLTGLSHEELRAYGLLDDLTNIIGDIVIPDLTNVVPVVTNTPPTNAPGTNVPPSTNTWSTKYNAAYVPQVTFSNGTQCITPALFVPQMCTPDNKNTMGTTYPSLVTLGQTNGLAVRCAGNGWWWYTAMPDATTSAVYAVTAEKHVFTYYIKDVRKAQYSIRPSVVP